MGRVETRWAAQQPFSADELLSGLGTKYIGRNAVVLTSTESTNREARRLADAGAPEGTLVVADYQTAGRGRLDRRWEAPPGSSLLMSLIFRPELRAAQVHRLTMVCALSLLDAVESTTGLTAGLKWPNDILINDAKVSGILAETGISGTRLEYAIVGIGLNVNLDPAHLPADLLMSATSLSQALGKEVERRTLLRALLRSVETRYEELLAGFSPYQTYMRRLETLGRQVTVELPDGPCTGVAEGVDADGALLVRVAEGSLQRILAGDVTLCP